jgi:hypothetical protein
MKIVKFKGGLGNQLFQYSFLKALEFKYHCHDVKGDFSYYQNLNNDTVRLPRIEKLNVKISKADSKDLSQICLFKHEGNPMRIMYKALIFSENLLNRKYFFESNRSYRDINDLIKFNYFDGYWQSWRYLKDIECILQKDITPKVKLSENTQNSINIMKKENAVFLGIRRGDYISTEKAKRHYGSFDIHYYKRAIDYIKQRVENPIFYVFSNDIKWVKKNMKFDCTVNYRDDELQTSDVEELFIMAACKHAIIVNSTFYWWGAWLIDNPSKIVIAPKKWFADNKPIDIVPETWIKI